VPALNVGQGTHYTEVSHGTYKSIQANVKTVPQIMLYMMPSTQFLIHYSQTILTLEAMQPEVLKAS